MNDGKEVAFWQEFGAHRDGACKLTSSQGNGGGRRFANHMCQYYTERNDGHAFATTVAIDGENSLRVLVTERLERLGPASERGAAEAQEELPFDAEASGARSQRRSRRERR